METHYFFGSNTPSGFVGGYEDILNSNRLIILKGGAGSGKSTLMRKVAEITAEVGYDTETYHCSSDVKSLDCVYIPTLSTAVVDGTAPHVIEANLPLARHFVFNLLDTADYKKITPHTAVLQNCLLYKKQYFNNAYANLKCAYALQNNLNAQISQYVDAVKLNSIASNILSLIDDNQAQLNRTQFASAITNNGHVDYYFSNFSHLQVITLDYEFELQMQTLLNGLKTLLDNRAKNYTLFINPLNPSQPEALKIGDYLVAPKRFFPKSETAFDLSLSVNSFNRHFVSKDTPVIEQLISRAIENLNYAHLTHLEIEKIYAPAMDWEDVNDKTERIIKLILS